MNTQYKSMWLLTALVILLQGCAGGPIPVADGQVLALAEQSTVTGIYSVLNGAQPLGEVWVKGAQSVVAWPQSGGWAWACLRFNCEGWLGYFRFTAQGQGNVANWKTWSDLAGWMKANGWVRLPSATLPGALTAGETVAGFLSQMSGAITGFLIIPVMPAPEEVERPIT
jgi:hypothetical protein